MARLKSEKKKNKMDKSPICIHSAIFRDAFLQKSSVLQGRQLSYYNTQCFCVPVCPCRLYCTVNPIWYHWPYKLCETAYFEAREVCTTPITLLLLPSDKVAKLPPPPLPLFRFRMAVFLANLGCMILVQMYFLISVLPLLGREGED